MSDPGQAGADPPILPAFDERAPQAWGFGRRALASSFLRSLAIQGSWNYRTMLGGGFAFALLPLLREVFGTRGPELEAAVARHAEHFNSHPYLVGVAVGAVARLEQEGEVPETVRRFKAAVKGPLGGIGDSLVWATWLPVTLLLALTGAWAGSGPFASVLLFLVLYNAGHLAIRVWAFRVGLVEGKRVGARLRDAALGHRTDLLVRLGTFVLGILAGVLLFSERALGGTGPVWPTLAVAGFVIGLTGGIRVWRPTALAVVGAILSIVLIQAVA